MSVDPEQATPGTGNSAVDTATQDNWEQRFKDTQAAYTQSQQELADMRKLMNGEDPDRFQQLLDRYGYELDADNPDDPGLVDEYADQPQQVNDPRIEQFEQFMAAQEAKEEQQLIQAEWDGWQQYVRTKAQEFGGVELTDRDIKSFQLDSVGDNGLPVPQDQADKILQSYLDERSQLIEQAVQQRKRPRAPHVPAGGTAADTDVDPAAMSRSDRVNWMVNRLNAEQA